VHVIPLLFEKSMQDAFDVVVLVDASEDSRRERLVRTRGLSEAEAQRMIDAQMPAVEKRNRARYIIYNDAGLEELAERAEEVWVEIEERPK
jgi:dephospho-CoA kinase